MEILETRVYRGPNQYALWPVIRLKVDLGELERYPTAKLPGFAERLLELIPTLAEHTCSLGCPGGLVTRMQEDEGTWLGHVLEHVAIELQCLVGTSVSFGKTRGDGLPEGQYHVVYSYVEEAVGLEAGRLAIRLIRHLLPPELEAHDPAPFDFGAELEKLVRLARRRSLGPTTAALVRAAEERGIPWLRLDDRSLVQLGHGKYQRRIQASITSETRQIAAEIASDKRLTHRILEDLGIPVSWHPSGNGYRILVVNGHVVAVAERAPGRVVDRTDSIHEDNARMAERAVQAVGLDVAGVDFISPDVSRSYKDVGGAIVEINAAPGFRMHLAPTEGRPRDVAGPVIDMLFPPGTPCRIPIAAVTGVHGRTAVARMAARILELAGHTVGMAAADARPVLRDPRVDAAVLETAPEDLVRSGLGCRRCSVGAVLDAGPGDDPAEIERLVVEVAQDFCVLDADAPRVASMAGYSPAEPIYVTLDRRSELVRRHIRERKRAVVLEKGLNGPMLVLYQGEEQIPLLWTRQVEGPDVRNAMFAAAVASGLGVGMDDIREGLVPREEPVREQMLAEAATRGPRAARAEPARAGATRSS